MRNLDARGCRGETVVVVSIGVPDEDHAIDGKERALQQQNFVIDTRKGSSISPFVC